MLVESGHSFKETDVRKALQHEIKEVPIILDFVVGVLTVISRDEGIRIGLRILIEMAAPSAAHKAEGTAVPVRARVVRTADRTGNQPTCLILPGRLAERLHGLHGRNRTDTAGVFGGEGGWRPGLQTGTKGRGRGA